MSTRASRGWWATRIAVTLVLLAAGSFQVHNLDIWLHARTGQWIVEHGEVPGTNVLSELHAEHPSVHDKWGFQVLAHGLVDGLGPRAVVLARLALLLALFALLGDTARRLGASAGATLLVLLLALVAARARFHFRPDLVSLVLLAVVARSALATRPDGRAPGRLVALQVLWVNLHGYFLLGWVVAGVAAAGQLLAGRRDAALRWLRNAALMAAACLLNPSGLAGWWHPFAILLDLRGHEDFYRASIVEFAPTFGPDPRGSFDRLAYLVLLALVVLVLGLRALRAWRERGVERGADGDGAGARDAGRAGWEPTAVLLVLAFGFMSVSLKRNVSLFAVAAAPAAAVWLGAALGAAPLARAAPWVAGALLAPLVAWGELSDTTSIHDGLERRAGLGWSRLAYPDAGIAFLAAELPDARVFTAFRYGSTFSGRRWPAQVASTNGNTHGYPTGWLVDVMGATSGDDPAAFDRCVAVHGSTAALLPMSTPLSVALLRRDDWTLVALGAREAVFVRRDAVEPVWLAEHDLEQRLALGRSLDWPRTPVEAPLPGIRRAVAPLTELELSALLFAGGYRRAAEEVVQLALETSPDDAEALGLAGLLARQAGRGEEARALLRRSLEQGGFNRFADEVREALR